MNCLTRQTVEFLTHSNYIESEYSVEALSDAKRAWTFAYENRLKKMDVNYILEIHKILLKRLNPRIAGKIRDCEIFIGGLRKDFISEQVIKEDLEDWMKGTKLLTDIFGGMAEHNIEQTHVEFEQIHPFEDGNGRVGRILYNIHRIKEKLPIHIIHEGQEQKEYYKWFEDTL